MAIIIEDGTCATASANSYVTVAEVDTYCSEQGYTSWASLATADKESSILRAMVYIEGLPFKGEKTDWENPLEFPRYGLYSDLQAFNISEVAWVPDTLTLIPKALKRGVCQATYEESVSAGVLNPSVTQGVKREKIDVLEVEYFTSSGSETNFSKILSLMKSILKNQGGNTGIMSVMRT